MEPEKKETKPFDPEDTGELDIPPHLREAAREALDKQGETTPHFDPESTSEMPFDPNSEFFQATDAKLRDESLAADRMFDLERLAPIVSDKSGSFDEEVIGSGIDPQVARRLTQYEVEKEFFAAPNEQFYEQTGLEEEMEEGSRLSEHQQSLLETVTKLSDGQGFEEVHPELARNEILPPTLAPPIDYDAIDTPKPAEPEPENPFAQSFGGEAVQANLTYDKFQVLTGEKDSLELLDRAKGPHPIVTVDRESLMRRSPPMSTEMKVAIGLVALAIPLFGWSIYLQTHANAEADRLQSEQSMALATESADKHSMANQMDEPFRMPEGSRGPTGAPSALPEDSGSGPRASGGDIPDWRPSEHPSPAPTPQQLEENRKIVGLAEQQEALGNNTQALFLLNAGLSKSPGDVQLIVATARAYINARDYVTARRILQSAIKSARNFGDYSILRQLLEQLPPG